MKTRKYLLRKLVEECGELIVAAVKHQLHKTATTLHHLENEAGDVRAILDILCQQGHMRAPHVHMAARARESRELDRLGK